MARWALVLAVVGCNRDLDSIEGYDLGHPESAAWAKDPGSERVMVVASDHEDVCALLRDPTGPERTTWTLSVWSTAAASYEADLPVDAIAVIRDGVLDDDYFGDGLMRIDDGRDELQVDLDVNFGPDRVRAHVKAVPCASELFADFGQ
jgi:hypothetical protein